MDTRTFTRSTVFLLSTCVAVGACGDAASTGPVAGTGTIVVTATTTDNLDPDGFEVILDGDAAGVVGVDGSLTLDGVPVGRREVELQGVAPNCAIDGRPFAYVEVAAEATASVDFAVVCTAPPDGRIYYFWSSAAGVELRVANADGTATQTLLPLGNDPVVARLAVSRDGERLLFSSYREGRWGLHTVGKDGSGLTQLTSDAHLYLGDAAWSPDGTRIAYLTGADPYQFVGIASMAADGSDVRTIALGDEAWWHSLDWSPDGTRILFSRETIPQSLLSDTRIWVAGTDGSGPTPITGAAPLCTDPAWGNGWALWHDYDARWSPDGSRLLVIRYSECDPDPTNDYMAVHVMNADGTGASEIRAHARQAAWSPDGSRIAFLTVEGHLGVIAADGTGEIQLVAGVGGQVGGLAWGR